MQRLKQVKINAILAQNHYGDNKKCMEMLWNTYATKTTGTRHQTTHWNGAATQIKRLQDEAPAKQVKKIMKQNINLCPRGFLIYMCLHYIRC